MGGVNRVPYKFHLTRLWHLFSRLFRIYPAMKNNYAQHLARFEREIRPHIVTKYYRQYTPHPTNSITASPTIVSNDPRTSSPPLNAGSCMFPLLTLIVIAPFTPDITQPVTTSRKRQRVEPANTVIDLTNSTKSQSLSLKKPKRDRHDNPAESSNDPSTRNINTSSVNDSIPPISSSSSSSRTNTKPATITTNNNDDDDDDLQFFTPSPRLAPDITRRTSNASLSSVTTINTTDHPIEPMVTDLAVGHQVCFIFIKY